MMTMNTTQVFTAIPIPCIMIICPFSSSHFATQIFPIDELLKPYNGELRIKSYIHLQTYNICRVVYII
jgi:hypothetical protein